MKSWLKGGLILAIIFSLYMISQPSCIGVDMKGESSCPTAFELFLDGLKSSFPDILLTLTVFFCIGAFIGWIIGIIKKSKKNN